MATTSDGFVASGETNGGRYPRTSGPFSHYFDYVRDGGELVVTDRGRAVARVVPVSDERTVDPVVAKGLVERPR
jgi:hypothetical protein